MACLSQWILCMLTPHCSFQSLIITLSYFMDASPVCGADINTQLLCTDHLLPHLSKSTVHIRHSRAQELGERKLIFLRELLSCRLWWSHFVHWSQKCAKQVCYSLHSKETSKMTWESKFGAKGNHQDYLHLVVKYWTQHIPMSFCLFPLTPCIQEWSVHEDHLFMQLAFMGCFHARLPKNWG